MCIVKKLKKKIFDGPNIKYKLIKPKIVNNKQIMDKQPEFNFDKCNFDKLHCPYNGESPYEKSVKIFGEKITNYVIFPGSLIGYCSVLILGQTIKAVGIILGLGISTVFIGTCIGASIGAGLKIGSSIK